MHIVYMHVHVQVHLGYNKPGGVPHNNNICKELTISKQLSKDRCMVCWPHLHGYEKKSWVESGKPYSNPWTASC